MFNGYLSVYYFHGYGSNGVRTGKLLSMSLGEDVTIVPWESNVSYEENLIAIEDFLKKHIDFQKEYPVFIGSSTGAVYASVTGAKFGFPCVLHNPVVKPVETLTRLGCKVADSYSLMKDIRHVPNPKDVFISKDDDVLNPNDGIEYWKGYCSLKFCGGNID